MPKSILITGCSTGGIGHALALSFQKRGLIVFASARKLSSMSSLSTLPNVHLISLDVTSTTSVTEAFEVVKSKTGGKLDYLVNNAGQGYTMPALDADIEQGKKMFDTNFWGVLRMVQTFSPLLKEAKGTVVNIGSIVAYLNVPLTSLYNASKAALHMLDSTLRLELAPLNISVLTVVTGAIETSFMSNIQEPQFPPNSFYLSIEQTVKARARGEDGYPRMKSGVFAEKVVKDVLGGKTGKVWRGENATTTWLANILLPVSIIDRIVSSGTGLTEMNQRKKVE
ncbi:NAD(P)-binding protein [Melanomma pulvis-pyrius CBS 109.77]|uniref:NAD(P)-binding protein n=1 Tax=Melanomma pulvis-pyrius CBS 109.77 TaxID=1314802 RepID=A0A6A6XLJ0_9PLEO|nr:NAD(P)-binding protein [Melanomma pulvis-pyrius CBS 109.77]